MTFGYALLFRIQLPEALRVDTIKPSDQDRAPVGVQRRYLARRTQNMQWASTFRMWAFFLRAAIGGNGSERWETSRGKVNGGVSFYIDHVTAVVQADCGAFL